MLPKAKYVSNDVQGSGGYIVDAETDIEVMPWELVERYNELVDRLAGDE